MELGVEQAAKRFLQNVDWHGEAIEAWRFDTATTNAERDKQVVTLPPGVQEAFRFYFDNVETRDWGGVGIFKLDDIAGETVYVVNTTTDGDDGFVEVFDGTGRRLATGQTDLDAGGNPITGWDEQLGAVRARVGASD